MIVRFLRHLTPSRVLFALVFGSVAVVYLMTGPL
jgi:hypothetical protein